MKLESEVMNYGRYDSYPSPSPGLLNFFSFKLENRKGQMHRFMCGKSLLSFFLCFFIIHKPTTTSTYSHD